MARVPSYYPEEGWNSENFQTENGLRLLRDTVRIQQKYKRQGIAAYKRIWKRLFRKAFDNIERDAMNAHRRRGGKAPQTVTINPIGDSELWEAAIDRAMRELGTDAVVETTPVIESMTTGLQDEVTSIFFGRQPTKVEVRRLKPRTTEMIATQVTGITETTRARLRREIQRAIDDRLTIVETVKRLRKRFPQIAENRIPTIARTEIGRAADRITIGTIQGKGVVSHISVVGCIAIEPNSPTYKGIPTCNIQDVPLEDAGQLTFHPNHSGTIVSSRFYDREGSAPTPATERGDAPQTSSGSGELEEVGDIDEAIDDAELAKQRQYEVARQVDEIHKKIEASELKIRNEYLEAKWQYQIELDRLKELRLQRTGMSAERATTILEGDPEKIRAIKEKWNNWTEEYAEQKMKATLARRRRNNVQKSLHELLFEGIDQDDLGDWDNVFTDLVAQSGVTNDKFNPFMDDIVPYAKEFIDNLSKRNLIRFNRVGIQVNNRRSQFMPLAISADNVGTVGIQYTKGAGVLIHELMHAIEYANPGIVERNFRFLRKRAEKFGAKFKRLKDIFPEQNYYDSEIAMAWEKNGRFLGIFSPPPSRPETTRFYAAKHYEERQIHDFLINAELPEYNFEDHRSNEVMAIGIELLHDDPVGFSKTDPEWFKFVLGNLRGEYIDNDIIDAAIEAQ